MTDTTPDPDRRPSADGRGRSTQVAIGALIFVAMVILLIGLASVLSRGGALGDRGSPSTAATTSPASSTGSPTGSAQTPSASPSGAAPTPSASAGPVAVLVGAGDIGDCAVAEDSMTADLLDGIEGTVFTTGDNAYESGTAADFANCYADSWGRHKDRTRPSTGNHDWRTGNLDGYFGYFGDAARGPDRRSWYSYDLGTWHVVVLDSECDRNGGCDADSPQGRWLAADLAASDASCTVAIWHKSRFSSGRHGNDHSVAPFWTASYDAGVDVVINGHDHDYERFAPQDPDGNEDRQRGIRQFVVGTGGTPLRRFDSPVANSELRAALTHGVLKLTLGSGSYDWEFIPVSGDFSDSGTASCH